MKKYFLLAAQRLLVNKRGFTLIEVLLACFVIITVVGVALPNISSFNRNIESFRAKNLAYMLAADIRRVQVLDMQRGRDFYAINFDDINNNYYISKGAVRLELQEISGHLNDNWRIKAINKQNVFYLRGSVNAYNYIDISRNNEPGSGYRVQILPVSGRIGVYKR